MIEKPSRIINLTQGLANQVLLLEGADQSYVFKWLHKTSLFGLQREQEFSLQQQLAQAGVAPEIIAYDADAWVLQEYIEATPLTERQLSARQSVQLAHALAIIHQQTPKWQGISLHQRLTHYAQQLEPAVQKRLRSFAPLLSPASDKQVLCHHDLAASHVLLTRNGVKVIDWEYAAWGDRLTDIASTIEINKLSAQQIDWLLHEYQHQTGVAIKIKQLHYHQQLVQWMYSLWYQLLEKDTEE